MQHKIPLSIKIVVGLYLALALRPAAAQVRSYSPPSPTAASLGVFGQIPVSEYNGVPQIDIPLYTIQAYDFKLPVSLTYHSGGFRQADEASWVGLGWALTGGGVIARSKRHLDDLGTNGYYRVPNRPCGDGYDQEPDMFYYNVGAYSGKFLLDVGTGANPTIRSFRKDNVKIELNYLANSFTLTDPEGNKYVFDDTEFATETVTGKNLYKSESYTSSWFLSYIELMNGDRITYTYLPSGTKVKRVYKSYTSYKLYSYTAGAEGCCKTVQDAMQNQEDSVATTSVISEKMLSRIDYPGGSIQMTLSDRTDLLVENGTPASKKLENLVVYTALNGVNTYLKQFDFTYDHFVSGSGEAATKSTRLRLRSVMERTQQAARKPYVIAYLGNTLPDKYVGTGYLGTDGLISAITYPTGGSTWFEFSPHPMGGGARIDRIYDKDPDNISNLRRFEYTGGKLMGKLKTGMEDTTSFIINVGRECCVVNGGETQIISISKTYRVSSDFSSLGEVSNGGIVGYDKVVTYYGENGENGKKESFFANTAPFDPNYISGQTPVPVPLNTAGINGSLVDEYLYRRNGASFVKIKQTHYDYESANPITLTAMRFAYDKCSEWSYPITIDWVRTTALTVNNYDQNGANPVTESATYTYGDAGNALPTAITETDSRGNTILTKNSYAKQRSDAEGGVYTTMLNKNMISLLLQKEEFKNSTPYLKVTSNYKDWFNNGKVIKSLSEMVSKNNATPEPTMLYTAYDEKGRLLSFAKDGGKPVSLVWGAVEPNPIAEVFNADRAPVQEVITPNFNDNQAVDIYNGLITQSPTFTTNLSQTYNFKVVITMIGSSPSATVTLKMFNTAGQQLYSTQYFSAGTYNHTVPLSNGMGSMGYYFQVTGAWASSGTVGVQYNLTSTYSYTRPHYNVYYNGFEDLTSGFVPGGKTGEKSGRGPLYIPVPMVPGDYIISWWERPASGGWEYKEQTINADGTGGSDFLIAPTGTNIDEVRMYPKVGRMVTYTYKPGVGMSGRHDERNRSTTYEYDDLLRLKIIRDNDGNFLKTFDYNYKN